MGGGSGVSVAAPLVAVDVGVSAVGVTPVAGVVLGIGVIVAAGSLVGVTEGVTLGNKVAVSVGVKMGNIVPARVAVGVNAGSNVGVKTGVAGSSVPTDGSVGCNGGKPASPFSTLMLIFSPSAPINGLGCMIIVTCKYQREPRAGPLPQPKGPSYKRQ